MADHEAEKISAEFHAIRSYYRCLADQAERATRGDCPAPLIPRREELAVVDGWVVWNGRPVWSPADKALTSAQPLRTRWTPSMARAACIEAKEQDVEVIRIHLQRAAERVREGNRSAGHKALRLAEFAYLESLLEQQRLAIRGEAAAPRVPSPEDTLELVDGWLMWKGQPVWWAGGESASASASVPGPAIAPAPSVQSRPRLRRLLTLPWRRAAA